MSNQTPSLDILRYYLYGFLASAFDRPLHGLIEPAACRELKEEIAPHWPTLAEKLDYLYSISSELAEEQRLEVEKDYARLFFGPTKLLVPPYESVWLENRIVMGHSTVQVIANYRRFGLEISDELKDMPDHIRVELEFLALLIEARLEKHENFTADELLQWEESFLNEHLFRWVWQFTKATRKEAVTSYYQILGALLEEFCDLEKELIANRQAPIAKSTDVNSSYARPALINAGSGCTLCGVCALVCKSNAMLYREEGETATLSLNAADCTLCRKCIKDCPQQALSIYEDSQLRSEIIEPLTLLEGKMACCSHCQKAFAPERLVEKTKEQLTDLIAGNEVDVEAYALCPECRSYNAAGLL